MIKAVIFDFGNVICRFDNTLVLRRVAERSGMSLGNLEAVVRQSADVIAGYEKGLVSSHHFFTHFSSLCRLDMEEAEFVTIYTDKFTPIPQSFDLIRRLKSTHKLGLLSNTSEWDFRHGIMMTEVFPLFDAVTLSFEVHALKPAPEIYHDAVRKLGVLPQECVYIDDIKEYADAAAELGMAAVHYRSPADLAERLKDILSS